MSLGERIHLARKQLDLTQEELGKALRLSRSFVNHLETDRKKPSLETLIKLAKILGVSLNWLADDESKLIMQDYLPINDKRTPYTVVIDKAINNDISPADLEFYLDTYRKAA
jgi:transcriptional regulator with XRE-family HTH domain